MTNEKPNEPKSFMDMIAEVFQKIEEKQAQNEPAELAGKSDAELIRAALVPIHVMCRRHAKCKGCALNSNVYPCAGSFFEKAAMILELRDAKEEKAEPEKNHE